MGIIDVYVEGKLINNIDVELVDEVEGKVGLVDEIAVEVQAGFEVDIEYGQNFFPFNVGYGNWEHLSYASFLKQAST